MKVLLISLMLCSSFWAWSQDTVMHNISTYYYEREDINIPSIQAELNVKYLTDKQKNSVSPIGLPCFVDYDFFDLAYEYEDGDNDVYILHFFSVNSPIMSIELDYKLPEDVEISVEQTDGTKFHSLSAEDNFVPSKDYKRGAPICIFTSELIIRVVKPKAIKKKCKVRIKTLYASTTPKLHTAVEESNTRTMLVEDDPNPEMGCNYTPCMADYQNWVGESKSTFRISVTKIIGVTTHYMEATGFLLNTATNYDLNLNSIPYAMTCFHFLDPMLDEHEDIYMLLENIEFTNTIIRFNHVRENCATNEFDMYAYVDGVLVIEQGNYETSRSGEEDYLFLQFKPTFDLSYFDDKNLAFSGWRNDLVTSTDYSNNTPYTVIHHAYIVDPDLEIGEQRYAIDQSYAVPYGDLIQLGLDEGFIYPGSSGAPIYDKNQQIIGMQIAQLESANCYSERQQMKGISFSSLWHKANLEWYLGDAEKAYTFNPSWDFLPEHCSDCEYSYDDGEEDMDCGGPCKPCRSLFGVNFEYSDYSVMPQTLVALENVTVTGSPSEPVTINKNTQIVAKNSITFNANVNIPVGVKLKATSGTAIEPIVVVRDPDLLCNLFMPNVVNWGNDYYIIVGNATAYEYSVINRNRDLVHSGSGPIFFDGEVILWDTNTGNNVDREANWGEVLYITLKLWGTTGGTITRDNVAFHAFPKQ